jgi:hypothetical protein
MDLIRQEVEKYAVVFPEVEFTIEDIHASKVASNEERIIRIPKVFYPLTTCSTSPYYPPDPFYACFISASFRACFGGGEGLLMEGHCQKYDE